MSCDCCQMRVHDEHKCRVRAAFYRAGTWWLLALMAATAFL